MRQASSVILTFLLMSCAHQNREYSCQDCQQTSIKEFEEQHEAQFTQAMQQTLEQLFKEKSNGANDPDKIQAFKVLAKTDAAKSYAFTKVYGVSAKYCGPEVEKKLALYKTRAANIISLGHYYYQHGIEAIIGGRDLSHSGAELSAGLQEMTDQLEQEHAAANEQQLASQCNGAIQALESLSMLYGEG